MHPTRTLPPGYVANGTLDLSKNRKALVWMNILGAVLFILFGWLFLWVGARINPLAAAQGLKLEITRFSDSLRLIALALAITGVMLVIHEAIHGLFFWLYTGTRPSFGVGPGYAYATAPGWFFPRVPAIVITMAPFVLISLAGLLALNAVSPGWFLPLVTLMTFNASGAVGDLAVVVWILAQRGPVLAQDKGDAMTLYIWKDQAAGAETL